VSKPEPLSNQCTCIFINNSPQPGRKELAKLGGGGKSLLGLLSHLPETGWKAQLVLGKGQFLEPNDSLGILCRCL